MTNVIVFGGFYLAALALVWFLAYRLGEKTGKRQALIELREDLNETVMEWNRRALAGDVVRSLELPGIHAVVRMLYDETDRQLDESRPAQLDGNSLRILR